MIYCPGCGLANRDNSRFCNECGQRLGEWFECPHCRFSNLSSANFCNHCGGQLHDRKAVKLESPAILHKVPEETPLEADVTSLAQVLEQLGQTSPAFPSPASPPAPAQPPAVELPAGVAPPSMTLDQQADLPVGIGPTSPTDVVTGGEQPAGVGPDDVRIEVAISDGRVIVPSSLLVGPAAGLQDDVVVEADVALPPQHDAEADLVSPEDKPLDLWDEVVVRGHDISELGRLLGLPSSYEETQSEGDGAADENDHSMRETQFEPLVDPFAPENQPAGQLPDSVMIESTAAHHEQGSEQAEPVAIAAEETHISPLVGPTVAPLQTTAGRHETTAADVQNLEGSPGSSDSGVSRLATGIAISRSSRLALTGATDHVQRRGGEDYSAPGAVFAQVAVGGLAYLRSLPVSEPKRRSSRKRGRSILIVLLILALLGVVALITGVIPLRLALPSLEALGWP